MTRHAAAYLRRSSVSTDNPGDASREQQLAAVRSLCGDDVEVFEDWGISGRNVDRKEYVRLKGEIEAGNISSVCAYSLSRLGRNTRELLTFVDLCQKHGVTFATKTEMIDTATAMGRATLTVFSAFDQLYAEQRAEQAAEMIARRKGRGDRFGQAPYGFRHVKQDGRVVRVEDPERPIAPLIEAYREAGSVLGACRLLKKQGIPAPHGGERWATSALTRILDENAPDLLPRKSRGGRRMPASSVLSGLLECPFCGATLTPNVHRSQFYCRNGARDRASHPRYTVREADLLPWVMAEANRFDPEPLRIVGDDLTGRKEAVARRLDRANELYMAGDIDRPKLEAEKVRAQRDLEELQEQEAVFTLPDAIEWDHEPGVVNRTLRAIIRRVKLDENLRPVEAEWTVPEWRA